MIAASVVLAACALGERPQGAATSPPPGPTTTSAPAADGTVVLTSADAVVTAEVVATPQGRQRGLMFREHLDDDAGMLFLFPGESAGGFWMKNTLIGLSIAYMARGPEGFEVLEILDMEPCEADPCRSYPPAQPYEAALEVNQGWFEAHDVAVGDTFEVEGDLPTAR